MTGVRNRSVTTGNPVDPYQMGALSSVHPGKFSPMSTKSFALAAALAALSLSPGFVPSLSAATLPGFGDPEADADLRNCTAEVHDDTPLGSGRVVAVDPAAGRITLEYRPLPLLPEGGVRVFAVEDHSLLKGFSAGDRVRFEVERDGRRFVLRHLENSN